MSSGRSWTKSDKEKLLDLKLKGWRCLDIANVLGRTERSCLRQYELLRMTAEERHEHFSKIAAKTRVRNAEVVSCRLAVRIAPSVRCPESVWLEGERRREAYARRTLSQEFFGDPPPGYSALDRRASDAWHQRDDARVSPAQAA